MFLPNISRHLFRPICPYICKVTPTGFPIYFIVQVYHVSTIIRPVKCLLLKYIFCLVKRLKHAVLMSRLSSNTKSALGKLKCSLKIRCVGQSPRHRVWTFATPISVFQIFSQGNVSRGVQKMSHLPLLELTGEPVRFRFCPYMMDGKSEITSCYQCRISMACNHDVLYLIVLDQCSPAGLI